jgi:hypothetical protein
MSDSKTAGPDSETDRAAALQAAAHARGLTAGEIVANYAPGSFGCHEALHTAALLMDLVEARLCDHPAILANAGWYRLAHEAHARLFDLYQSIGAEHLGSSDDDPLRP